MSDDNKYIRQIIDDYFLPDGPLPRCGLEDIATSENAKQNWHEANERFAACASMYKWLDEKGYLKKEAFCYDVIPEEENNGKHFYKQINFAVDSKDLIKYKEEMLKSGIPNADKAVDVILAKKDCFIQPSILSGATCLTWTMMTYRDNYGSVGRSWETPHEQHYYTNDVTGIGNIVSKRCQAGRDLKEGKISEDEYFEIIKSGIKELYKLDKKVFLVKVPLKFVYDTKNPNYKSVCLPCDKSLSDNERKRITVKTSNIYQEGNKYTIYIGNVDTKIKASVKKGCNYQDIYMDTIEIAKDWSEDRRKYLENFKKNMA